MRARQPYRHLAERIWALAASGLPALRVHGVLFAGFCSMRFRRGLVGRQLVAGRWYGACRAGEGVLTLHEVLFTEFRSPRLRRGLVGRHWVLWSCTVLARSFTEPPGRAAARSGRMRFCSRHSVRRGSDGAGWATLGALELLGVGAEFHGACRSGSGALRAHEVLAAAFCSTLLRRGRVG